MNLDDRGVKAILNLDVAVRRKPSRNPGSAGLATIVSSSSFHFTSIYILHWEHLTFTTTASLGRQCRTTAVPSLLRKMTSTSIHILASAGYWLALRCLEVPSSCLPSRWRAKLDLHNVLPD